MQETKLSAALYEYRVFHSNSTLPSEGVLYSEKHIDYSGFRTPFYLSGMAQFTQEGYVPESLEALLVFEQRNEDTFTSRDDLMQKLKSEFRKVEKNNYAVMLAGGSTKDDLIPISSKRHDSSQNERRALEAYLERWIEHNREDIQEFTKSQDISLRVKYENRWGIIRSLQNIRYSLMGPKTIYFNPKMEEEIDTIICAENIKDEDRCIIKVNIPDQDKEEIPRSYHAPHL